MSSSASLCWQSFISPVKLVDVLNSSASLSRRKSSDSQSAEDFKENAFTGYLAEKKKRGGRGGGQITQSAGRYVQENK